jgi:type IV secretory pathway VirB2 component (pilin)
MDPVFDPQSQNALVAALGWIDTTLLGSLATLVAVIAVASVGFMLLSGRIDMRRGVQVILGCFILFGASSIAAGIVRAASGTGPQPEVLPAPPPAPILPQAAAPTRSPTTPFDPYAGAAVPPR